MANKTKWILNIIMNSFLISWQMILKMIQIPLTLDFLLRKLLHYFLLELFQWHNYLFLTNMSYVPQNYGSFLFSVNLKWYILDSSDLVTMTTGWYYKIVYSSSVSARNFNYYLHTQKSSLTQSGQIKNKIFFETAFLMKIMYINSLQ